MLLDIPANLELIIADSKGVRSLRRGDDLDSDQFASGAVKVMGMRIIGASQTAINRVQSTNSQVQFGALMFNVGAGLLLYQQFGAVALMIYGVIWMIGVQIAHNTKHEVDSLQHSAPSSSASRARTADDSN